MNIQISHTFLVILIASSMGFSGCVSSMSKGSARSLYTIADTLEVNRGDIGKDVQLVLDQKIFFKLENDSPEPGKWELVDYTKATLLLLSDTPWTEEGYWGVLLRAKAMGSAEVDLRFTPNDGDKSPQDVKFEISIRRS